jgi:hypothetical protein
MRSYGQVRLLQIGPYKGLGSMNRIRCESNSRSGKKLLTTQGLGVD